MKTKKMLNKIFNELAFLSLLIREIKLKQDEKLSKEDELVIEEIIKNKSKRP